MRTHSTINRNYTTHYESGPCPTWMKTLEDKYKRLHMKIVYNTSASRCRSRPSGAFSTISVGCPTNPRFSKISQRLPETQIYRPKTALQVTSKETGGDQSKHVFIRNTFEKLNRQTDECNEISDNDADDEKSYLEFVSKSEVCCDKDSLMLVMDQHEYSTEKNFIGRGKFKALSTGENAESSDGNGGTIVSKTKSCPSVLVRQEHIRIREPTFIDKRTEHRKQSKLFQRMSKEAQTAINETLSERKINHGGGESMCIFSNFKNNLRTSRTDYYRENSFKHQSKFVIPTSCAAKYSFSSSSSMTSSLTPREPTKIVPDTTRFPVITTPRTNSTFKSVGQRNVLLPGVGRYQIPILREQTFQVTGAEYDIRYREVIHCEGRESVTPPSDILEQAIMKCQEWLTKHAVYAKR